MPRNPKYDRYYKKCQERHQRLVESLGGVCVLCGATDGLQIDHYPKPITWKAKDFSWATRLKKYEQEAREGKVRVLCAFCNNSNKPRRDENDWSNGTV